MKTECDFFQDPYKLFDFLEGRTADEETEPIVNHLKSCGECLNEVEAYLTPLGWDPKPSNPPLPRNLTWEQLVAIVEYRHPELKKNKT